MTIATVKTGEANRQVTATSAEVTLNFSDLCKVIDAAYAIQLSKDRERDFRHENFKRHSNHSDIVATIIGLLGEHAAAKFAGFQLDDSVIKNGGNGGFDGILASGERVEVKTSSYSTNPEIAVNTAEGVEAADLFISATPIWNLKVRLNGFVTQEDFKRDYFYKNYGYGERFVCNKDSFQPMELIKAPDDFAF